MTTREDILKIVQDFPEGTGVPFIRETLRVSDTTVRYWLRKLVKEGLVREEKEFVWRKPYYWFLTYYPVEIPVPPPPPPPIVRYIHVTLVYNVKTEDEAGRDIDISITFDFDCVDTKRVKDTLKRFLFLKGHTWLESKFGTQMPEPAKWAEEEERPSDIEIADGLREKGLDFTVLHWKWSYWRQFGNKSEEAEGDLEDWEDEMPTGPTWTKARKGRRRKPE